MSELDFNDLLKEIEVTIPFKNISDTQSQGGVPEKFCSILNREGKTPCPFKVRVRPDRAEFFVYNPDRAISVLNLLKSECLMNKTSLTDYEVSSYRGCNELLFNLGELRYFLNSQGSRVKAGKVNKIINAIKKFKQEEL